MREHLDAGAPRRIVSAPLSRYSVIAETLDYVTEQGPQFIDITDEVRAVVQRSGIVAGQVTVFSKHTTAAVIVNEHEPLLLHDMARTLARLAPHDDYYEHNDFSIRTVNVEENEPANGHSHCQHLFLGGSETLPIADGEMVLGRWQSIFLVELDHARPRSVLVQVMGLTAE
jgi:secondary thiamine-phosphate synthase enzyme